MQVANFSLSKYRETSYETILAKCVQKCVNENDNRFSKSKELKVYNRWTFAVLETILYNSSLSLWLFVTRNRRLTKNYRKKLQIP